MSRSVKRRQDQEMNECATTSLQTLKKPRVALLPNEEPRSIHLLDLQALKLLKNSYIILSDFEGILQFEGDYEISTFIR